MSELFLGFMIGLCYYVSVDSTRAIDAMSEIKEKYSFDLMLIPLILLLSRQTAIFVGSICIAILFGVDILDYMAESRFQGGLMLVFTLLYIQQTVSYIKKLVKRMGE